MKSAIQIYLRNNVSPEKYGFIKDIRGWVWKDPRVTGGLFIEEGSLRITPTSGYSSPVIALLIRIAEDKGLLVDDEDFGKRNVVMRLTKEEATAVMEMRGRALEEKEKE